MQNLFSEEGSVSELSGGICSRWLSRLVQVESCKAVMKRLGIWIKFHRKSGGIPASRWICDSHHGAAMKLLRRLDWSWFCGIKGSRSPEQFKLLMCQQRRARANVSGFGGVEINIKFCCSAVFYVVWRASCSTSKAITIKLDIHGNQSFFLSVFRWGNLFFFQLFHVIQFILCALIMLWQ